MRAFIATVSFLFMLGAAVDADAAKRRGKKRRGKAQQTQVVKPTEAPAEEPAATAVPDTPAEPEAAETEPEPEAVTEVSASAVEGSTSEAESMPVAEEYASEQAADAGPGDNRFGLYDLGLSVGPKFGATIPTNKLDATWFAGIDVGYQLPFLNRLLGVGVEFAYARPALSGSGSAAAAGDYTYNLNEQIMFLAVEVFGSYPLGDLTPYAGVGYGFYFLRSDVTAFDMTNTETQMRSGLQARGGAGYRLGPGDIFLEARYHFTNFEFMATGDVNAGGVTTALGYRLFL